MTTKRDISHFNILDWNFIKEDSRHYLHNFCWYPSRFIPIIPAHLIQALSRPNETVLDPFCGAGTTLIEAIKLKRNAIGVELNPVGAFIAQTKAKTIIGESVQFKKLKEFRAYLGSQISNEDNTENLFNLIDKHNDVINFNADHSPNFTEIKDWYNHYTLQMLVHLFNYIESNFTGLTKDLCRIFLIAILMNASGYPEDKNYAYFADNVKPKGRKAFKNAFRFYYQKLCKFINEYEIAKSYPASENSCDIYNADSRRLPEFIQSKVDLVVTSPPYLGVTDYTTAFRLAYLWFDFVRDNEELAMIKKQEIGARWKRKKESKLDDYLADMAIILNNISIRLKKEKYMCLVIGESKKFNKIVNSRIIDIATKEFKFEFIDAYERNIQKKYFIHPTGGGVQKEEILIFRKG